MLPEAQEEVAVASHKQKPDAGCRYCRYPEKQDSDRLTSDFAHPQKEEEKQYSQNPEHGRE